MNKHDDNIHAKVVVSGNLQRYFPLKVVFSCAFGLVFLLSGIIASIAYYRLVEFQGLLNHTMINSMPKVMNYAKMYSQVNELTYSTENLTGANTQGQRRIAYLALVKKIEAIPPLVEKLSDRQRLAAQIKLIGLEVDALNQLIEERLSIVQKLDYQRNAVFNLHSEATRKYQQQAPELLHAIGAIIVIAQEGLTFKQLNKIKQSMRAITNQHNVALSTLKLSAEQEALLNELRDMVVGTNGLLVLKTQRLRVFGRTRGRADFVRNLVIDYARLAEYESFKYKKSVLLEAKNFSIAVEKQIKTLGLAGIIALIIIIGIIFFIQRHLIRRLLLLNKKVMSRLKGENSDLEVGGHDEIADIDKSFEEFAKTIERQKHELLQTALTDGLTNIANRRALDKTFKHLMLSAQRQKWPITVLMLDVDNFKAYNDFYGHIAGDECLQTIANILKSVLQRPDDFVSRYGGEEFVCLMPNTKLEGAKVIATSIIERLAQENIPHQYSDVAKHVTLSIGVSICDSGDKATSDSLLKLADNALYRAKNKGKNCYSV